MPDTAATYTATSAAADYPHWRGRPRRTLVLCAHPRSGSTLLAEAIAAAGSLGRPLEYFQAGHRPLFEARWKPSGIRDYIAILHRWRTAPTGTFAVKLFWRGVVATARELDPAAPIAADIPGVPLTDGEYRRLFAALGEALPDPVFVYMKRRDVVRQAVSIYRATQSGIWQARAHADAAALPQPPYDFERILAYLGRIHASNAHWEACLRANGLACHPILYEDLVQDYEGALRGLFDALGQPDTPIAGRRLRKLADRYSDALVERFLEDFTRAARG
ncbi:MAG: Stf0 family sulfotransferase [Rhizomicrobium sp.]